VDDALLLRSTTTTTTAQRGIGCTNFFFSPFFLGPVHYPSVRSKNKERTSLSVVSLLLLLLLPVRYILELLVYLVFIFRAFICGFDPNPVCLHLISEIFRINNRGLSVLPMRGASDD